MGLPIVQHLRAYNLLSLRHDSVAGLTVAVILIPQAMAYSLLAGLDPIYGLYGALFPLLIYPLFATSNHLSIGPVALMSIIVLGGVSVFAEPGSEAYLKLVLMSALLAGIIQILFALFKLGNLAKFLSKPVMSGFISAAGIIIAISQVKYLLTLEIPRRVSILQMINDIIDKISNFNATSAIIGFASIACILLLKKVHKAIPGALIVVILGCLVTYFFQLNQNGVPILGDLPTGLPGFSLSFFEVSTIIDLLPISIIIAIIGFIGSYSISKSIGNRTDIVDVKPNNELLSLGLAKAVGSFFLAMPSTGSFTRSAINYEAGSKTPVSNWVSFIILALTLQFLSGLFFYLPDPILASIVITSVFSLIDISYAKRLFFLDKRDFVVLVVTCFSTLFFGIVNGVIIGVLASFMDVIWRSSKVKYAVLGKLPILNTYRSTQRFPNAVQLEGILIIRFSQTLYFANAPAVINVLEEEISKRPEVKNIILSLPTFGVPDSTATTYIFDLLDYCSHQGVQLFFTDITGPVRDYMHNNMIFDHLGENHFYLTIEDAVDAIEKGISLEHESKKYSRQSNLKKTNPYSLKKD